MVISDQLVEGCPTHTGDGRSTPRCGWRVTQHKIHCQAVVQAITWPVGIAVAVGLSGGLMLSVPVSRWINTPPCAAENLLRHHGPAAGQPLRRLGR